MASATQRARIDMLKTLIQGSPLYVHCPGPECATILAELESVVAAEANGLGEVSWLLQILHATRSLDSSLRLVTHLFAYPAASSSLAAYLRAMTTPPPGRRALPNSLARNFEHDIVHVRNRYMHEAGAFPSSQGEVNLLLSDMQRCLAAVLALIS